MTTVDVTYGGGPEHQACLIKLDGVPYDPDDLARLGREVVALEAALAEERHRTADLERELTGWREKAGRLERHAAGRTAQWKQAERRLEWLRKALAQMCEERECAAQEAAALRARMEGMEAAAGVVA